MVDRQVCYFKVPDQAARKAAVGSLAGSPYLVKKIIPVLMPLFKPIPKPGPDDWLFSHDEDGQTYETFLSQPHNLVSKECRTIAIQPLVECKLDAELVQTMRRYVQCFFKGTQTVMLKARQIGKLGVPSRVNEYTEKVQYNASHILKKLESMIRKDWYCLIAITEMDLYHRDDWNYIFGLGSLKNRTGIFSTARFDPSFFGEQSYEPVQGAVLRSGIKVMTHEIGHMFGIKHCVHFSCLMNGSNHAEESRSKPIEFCPVCLRKLHSTLKFDFLERYLGLLQLTRDCGELSGWSEYLAGFVDAVRAVQK